MGAGIGTIEPLAGRAACPPCIQAMQLPRQSGYTGERRDLMVKAAPRIDTVAATLKTETAQSTNRAIYALGGLIGVLFVLDRVISLFGVGN